MIPDQCLLSDRVTQWDSYPQWPLAPESLFYPNQQLDLRLTRTLVCPANLEGFLMLSSLGGLAYLLDDASPFFPPPEGFKAGAACSIEIFSPCVLSIFILAVSNASVITFVNFQSSPSLWDKLSFPMQTFLTQLIQRQFSGYSPSQKPPLNIILSSCHLIECYDNSLNEKIQIWVQICCF